MSASVTGDRAAGRSRGVEVLVLAVLVAVNLAVGALDGLAAQDGVDGWYADADKVAWTPPDGVFAPVWTVLYVLMAVAAWLVWRRSGWSGARGALTLYVVQLALNAAWTPVFFNGRLPWVALAVIVVLLGVLVATAFAFARHSRAAAWLLVPYVAWVAYATTLNLGVAVLN
jgi:tryptophan-rich sensory protein